MHKATLKMGAALLLCAFLSPAAHAKKKCTRADADAAQAMIDHLGSWEKIDQGRRRYGQCDDGSISDGISEAVARRLVDNWDTLPTLANLIKKDRALKPFVTRHLNETLNSEDLEKIQVLATSSCLPGLKKLCADLNRAATEGLR
ncbi:hypothetical protein [Massilia sp. CCM 8734]|uniref:hypothetical protein n=1 Tax=Massilia sp. CCM 8734 TaxID=2609283 RepID=UPI0014217A59|nr:hypothetical protein [Massilia sp. CCM 8734]NHZ96616.1 hypothetical protein [Massilia sp. CCM 8734]